MSVLAAVAAPAPAYLAVPLLRHQQMSPFLLLLMLLLRLPFLILLLLLLLLPRGSEEGDLEGGDGGMEGRSIYCTIAKKAEGL